jgi:hypothetical protein
MQDIDGMTRGRTEIMDNMNDIINNSITQIKVLSLILLFSFALNITQNTHPTLGDRDRNNGSDERLSGILDTIIGTTNTILNIFNEASDAIPVPFVKPLVASVACLLTAVQVSSEGLVRCHLAS